MPRLWSRKRILELMFSYILPNRKPKTSCCAFSFFWGSSSTRTHLFQRTWRREHVQIPDLEVLLLTLIFFVVLVCNLNWDTSSNFSSLQTWIRIQTYWESWPSIRRGYVLQNMFIYSFLTAGFALACCNRLSLPHRASDHTFLSTLPSSLSPIPTGKHNRLPENPRVG